MNHIIPLQSFTHEKFGTIRIILVDNHHWFVGKDITHALNYKSPCEAIYNYVKKADKQNFKPNELPTEYLNVYAKGLMCINESGLHSLIFKSKSSTAEQFYHWITKEVLPHIK